MRRYAILLGSLLAADPAAALQAPPADSVATLRESARRAEAEVERLARWLAPLEWGGGAGSDCDEIVGRFCLKYEDGRPPDPPPDPPRVVHARRLAIEALRLPFTWLSDDLGTVAPLVRYLVEDDRAGEAVAAARTFAALSGDSVWGPLLVGFALHGAAEDSAAQRHFETALAAMDPSERRVYEDPAWILSRDDRKYWEELDAGDRASAAARLWRIADPFFRTAGNERWNEHIARRVWARMLEMAPRVRESLRWGADMEQLLVRYGPPAGRTREQAPFRESMLVEHFDPDQLAFVPPDALIAGLPPAPAPGEPWPLQEPRSRAGYAPRTVARVYDLAHQATRFPAPNGTAIRVDAALALDSLPTAAVPDAELFLLDRDARILTSSNAVVRVRGDTAAVVAEAMVTAQPVAYSLEAIEGGTGTSWRARWALSSADTTSGAPLLSDPLLAQPFDAALPVARWDTRLAPHASLRFRRGQRVGVYAEIGDARPGEAFDVEVSLRRAEEPAVMAKVASWIGRTLGLASERAPTRLRWTARAPEAGRPVLAFDVPLDVDDDGLHFLVLRVRAADGGEATTRRLVLIGG